MKLLSCYIEGYGKIKQQEYIFQDGMTVFCQDNGEGKTTLASFIKAMFYGLEGYTARTEAKFCERKHFYPFDGGKFGGNLLFSWREKTYKIERYFGEMKGETCKVYCEDEETAELGEDIGKTVFGVDAEAFCRTVFIGSGEIEIKSTSSINAKLGSFLQGIEEEEDIKVVLKRLEEARKKYKPDRRSGSAEYKIPTTEEKIKALKAKLENAKRVQVKLEEKRAYAETLNEEIEGLTKKILAAQEENNRLTMQETYEGMQSAISDKEKARQEIASRYPSGIPKKEETRAVNDCIVRGKELSASLSSAEFSDKDCEKLARLEECFVRGLPTEEQILSAEKDIKKLNSLDTEIEIACSKEPTAREKALAQKFAHTRPSAECLAQTAQKVEAYKQTKKAYDALPESIYSTASASAEKKPSKGYAVLAVFASLLCVVGIALMPLVNMLVGVAGLAIGVILLLADGFMYLNKKSNASQMGTMSAMNPEKQRKEGELRRIEDSIKAVLMPYGYYSDYGVDCAFEEMCKDVEEYEQYLASVQQQKQALAEKQAEKQALEDKLTAFFRGYGLSEDTYFKRLSNLQGMCKEYYSLKERKKAQESKSADIERAQEENRAKVEAYKRRYGLTELRVDGILEDIRAYERLSDEIAQDKAKAGAYKQEKGLSQQVTAEKVDIPSLTALKDEKIRESNTLEQEIGEDEQVADSIEGIQTEIEEEEERLKLYKQKYDLLKAAEELLNRADGRLLEKYVHPIKEEFVYYATLLETTLGEKIAMNKNLEITFEKNGEVRSERHLSAGQRSICALCFRLALIKNMYKNNLPFLILDDPFVSLDKGHMEKVQVLLTELSKQMQMVYFTCHESRSI